jgi:hypothetical protein
MKLLHVCVAFISTLAPVSAQNYTANACLAGFAGLGLDLRAFERYDEFFSEDSVMTLAQAGAYTGPADIAEYVRFATDASPYVDTAVNLAAAAPQLKGISDDGSCDFLTISVSQYNTSSTISRSSTFNAAGMARIFYELSDDKISRINIFYSQPYLDFFFGNILNNGRTRTFICNVIEDKCPETYALNNKLSTEACSSQLETLPVTTGDRSYFDGYAQGCRALHGAFASINSAHCPHISYVPETDAKGQTKCQNSSEIAISDLFAPEDLVSFDNFVQSPESFIESLDGYLLISMEEEESLEPISSSKSSEEPSSAPSGGEEDIGETAARPSSKAPEEPASAPSVGYGDRATAALNHSIPIMTLASIVYAFLMP